jgi:hypothetical protein
MAQIRHRQEMLTDAGADVCLEAASRALDAIRARPQATGLTVTGGVGSYGMYNMHDCKNHEDLPVSLEVTVDDLGRERRITLVAESRWPFENIAERVVGQYETRLPQLVARIHGTISQALTPVGVS